MVNYTVILEAAWLVREVKSVDDAMSVAISEAGKRLNAAKMEYIDVEVGTTYCPFCGEPFDSAFVVAGMGLVGLLLEMRVLTQRAEHAERIAKKGIGKALKDAPLKVVDIEEME
jgi:uncharacterized protein (UPF0212 family)